MGIINSLLDTDFYKLLMAQVILHKYPATIVRYRFKCRNKKQNQTIDEINKEIDHLCTLRFTEDELIYLSSIPYFKRDFIEYLRIFQLNRNYIKARLDKNKRLYIEIAGPWISTVFFEVPVLAIISEIYSKYCSIDSEGAFSIKDTLNRGKKILTEKIGFLTDHLKTGQIPEFKFADLGTRRRYSHEWHETVLDTLKTAFRPHIFVGTSNIYFAKKMGLKPIGTMSHEWLQAHQRLGHRLPESQTAAFEAWIGEYRGYPGIALTDVVGFNAFLREFDLYFAKLFDGCRHDSGDPTSWCVKLIEHYDKLGIDPKTKTAVFTDSLNFEKAVELHQVFHEMIKISFGIGTNLTNDVGITPLDVVIKMIECNGRPVAKLCDSEGKNISEDKKYRVFLKKVYKIQ